VSLRDNVASALLKHCEQCGRPFAPNSPIHRYCEAQCRTDAASGREKAETLRRRETGFAWPPVVEARPVTVKIPQRRTPKTVGRFKTAAILPDPQIGFWRDLYDGSLTPFHDERAMSIALQIIEAERPDKTIWLGDVCDFASFGRYRQEAGFQLTVQPTIETAHTWVAMSAAASNETEYLEGNHDLRLHTAVVDNVLAAAGVRKAKSGPHEWPAMSLPSLLRLDELGVKYVGAYPAGATYINDSLACIHGRFHGARAMQQNLDRERVSIIQGHTHHVQREGRTRNMRGQPHVTAAYSPGCLCRIDGAVPGRGTGIDAFGRPVRSWQDWQQGMAIVRYDDRDQHHYEQIDIIEGWAYFGGQEWTA
jgi:hypothetical protein